jgi:hypothetical protein
MENQEELSNDDKGTIDVVESLAPEDPNPALEKQREELRLKIEAWGDCA